MGSDGERGDFPRLEFVSSNLRAPVGGDDDLCWPSDLHLNGRPDVAKLMYMFSI